MNKKKPLKDIETFMSIYKTGFLDSYMYYKKTIFNKKVDPNKAWEKIKDKCFAAFQARYLITQNEGISKGKKEGI